MSSADLLVVGGGLAGASVALEAASRGAAVTLVERDQPGTGATGASAGMVAPQYESSGGSALFRFGLHNRSAFEAFVARFEALAQRPVAFRRDGMLVAAWTPEEDARARVDAGRQGDAGCRAEVLEPGEAREIHPGVADEAISWLWLPDEGQVDAQRLAAALDTALQAAGVGRIEGEVERIRTDQRRVEGVVLEGERTLDASRVVLAAGAWTTRVAGLPRELPVRPVRGQMTRLRPREPAPWPIVADHRGLYLVPRGDGTVLSGSTMEEVGFDTGTTEEAEAALREGAGRLVPGLDEAAVVETWAGLRPMSVDGRPYLGPDPELDGLFYATGHGRNGILLAPLTGRIVVDLALEGATDVDWEPFRVDR